VGPAADGKIDAVLACELDRRHHIGRVRASDDDAGMLVDHPVVDLSGDFVGFIARRDRLTLDACPQFLDSRFCHDVSPL
jgi:hypothetical protein